MLSKRDIDDALEVVDNLERMALESAEKLAERERQWRRSAVRLDADKVREVIAELRARPEGP